jgi:hypothetical protein
MKAEKSRRIKARRARPAPEVTVLTPKIAAVERREATRFPIAREAKHHLCASRRSIPSCLRGATTASLAQYCARTNARGFCWREWGKPHARVLFEN